MSPNVLLRTTAVLLILAGSCLMAQPDRIPERVDPGRRAVLRGHTTPRATPQLDRGPVDPALRLSSLSLMLKRTPAQQAVLDRLLDEQQNPSSPNYHNWLTPEQFADRFSLSQSDFDKVTAWLAAEGLTVDYAAPARNWILFSGPAAQVESAFQTRMRHYLLDGKMRSANASDPSVPQAIAPLVAYLSLNDFPMASPHPQPRPLFTDTDGSHSLAPGDLATIYDVTPLYQMGINGSGQKIAVVGQSDVHMTDMQNFRSGYGLPKNDPQVTLIPGSGDPGYSGDEMEADLDLQFAGGLAPNATVYYLISTNAVLAAQYAINQNLAPIVSMSFGACGQLISSTPVQFADAYRSLAQQANAQGITWLVSSGDSGAAGCDAGGPAQAIYGLDVNILASVPEVTGVGGTMFNEGSGNYWSSANNSTTKASALSYIPETSWNDTQGNNGIWSSGGGVSQYYSKPSWQTGTGVPSDGARDVPDLALSASGHDAYRVLMQGKVNQVMGTSAACPSFAGMVALLNQYLLSAGKITKSGLGNINPNLYHLAQVSPGVFHDVTTGSNIVPCKSGTKDCTSGKIGYSAGPGYDLVTGWGSVDAYNLITGWNATSVTNTTTSASASPSSLAVTATTTVTATVTASSGSLSPSGTVTFSLGATTLGTATLSASSSGVSTASITVSGSQLATGNNTITAAYGGSAGFGSSSGTATVTVTVSTGGPTTTTLAANPAGIQSTGSTTLTATVKAASGSTSPGGAVSFMLGSATLGTANLSGSGGSASATLSVNGKQLAAGANSISAVYAGSGGFGGSAGSANVTVTVSATSTSMSVTANPSGIASTGNSVVTAQVTAGSGTATPTGSVTFTRSGTSLGTATLAGSGATASASITVSGSQLAAGNNTIAASYAGNAGFGAASGSVAVTVSAATSNTTTSVSANPTAITTNSTTALTATVTAAGGATPAGQVSFVVGNITLGAATLSGSGTTATATFTVSGSRLAVGSNSITGFYSGGSGFNGSSGSATVTVSVPTSGSSVIPSVVPTPIYQQATDADGYSWFYTVRLSEIAGTATALTSFTITTNGGTNDYTSNIPAWFGSATIPAKGTLSTNMRTKLASTPVNRLFSFAGKDANGQTWTQQLSVPFMPGQISASMLVTSSPGTVVQSPSGTVPCNPSNLFYQQLNLQEQNGYEVQLTKFIAGGYDLSANIPDWFGSWRLAPLGTLQAGICWSIGSPPTTLNYEIDGVDTAGNKISTTAAIPFNPAPSPSGGSLGASVKSVTWNAAYGSTASSQAAVGVTIPAGQAWNATLFPANQKTSWLVYYPQSGSGPGTVNLVASAAGLATGVYTATLVLQSVNTVPQFVNVPITFTVGSSGSVSIGGISNSWSGKQTYAPGMLLTVYGTNMANATQLAPGAPLPYSLAGTSVSINGVPAPLYFVSPGQINIQIPYEIPTRSAVLAVNNNGQVATYTFSVAASAPGICQSGGSLWPNTSATRGQTIFMFITGEGDVSPFVATGTAPAGTDYTKWPQPRLPLTMTVGGIPVTPLFVAVPNWSVGATQVNFTVPNNAGMGSQPVVVTVGGVASPPVNLKVQSASANVQFTFTPANVNQSSDGNWYYTATLAETAGVGVTFNKLMVFGNDYSDQIADWFGSTRLPANASVSSDFIASCGCAPPWDGAWQITGTDDNGNTNTWNGVVHLLGPSAGSNLTPRVKPSAAASASEAIDALALAPSTPETPESARPAAEASPLFDLLFHSGAVPLAPPPGAVNARAARPLNAP